MSALWVPGTVAVLLVAPMVTWCVSRARRLDRLHVRLDAARAGLNAALDRRVAVARLLLPRHAGPIWPQGEGATAGDGGAAVLATREAGESALTRLLADVDRGTLDLALHAELVDAELLLVVARRVHNDAVRDTLALRSRRLVRWLRLAGTAPPPLYFDIAEPDTADDAGQARATRSASTG